MKSPSEVSRLQCKNHTEEPQREYSFFPQPPKARQNVSLYGKARESRRRYRKREGSPRWGSSGFWLCDTVRAGKCRLSVGGRVLGRPLGPDFRAPGRRIPAFPTQRCARVKTQIRVAGAMEAPVKAEVENEDGESSCGDLCFMDKGLRR